MRLVSQATVGAWVTGSPEIFFDGSRRQICAPLSPEGVAVACRQLRLGAASIPSRIPSDPEGLTFTPGGINGDSTPFVEPGALLFGSHCNGFEDSLLECTDTRRRSGFERCRGRTVSVACVSAAGPGALPNSAFAGGLCPALFLVMWGPELTSLVEVMLPCKCNQCQPHEDIIPSAQSECQSAT